MLDYLTTLSTRFTTRLGSFLGFDFEESTEKMTANRAVKYAPVWYCVNKIAGDVGKLPLTVNRLNDRETNPDRRHPAYRLVGYRPNAYQTAFQWKQQGMVHALLWGNWRAAIIRDDFGNPTELIPLLPDRTDTGMVDGEKWHLTMVDRDDRLALWADAEANQYKLIAIADTDVLHIPGMGFDGVKGKSVIQVAAESFGTGLSTEKQVGNLAKRGFSGGLILEAPPAMFRNEDDAKRFLEFFRANHDGDNNAGKTALLREGIKANMIAMNGRDSQWIENRVFQRQEVMLWFGLNSIPGDGDTQSYDSLEENNNDYLTGCLDNWLTKIEQECWAKLLTEVQKQRYTHSFDFNRFMLRQANMDATSSFAQKMIMARVLSPNEVRTKWLKMNPYEGGDSYDNPAIDTREDVSQVPGDNEEVGAIGRTAIVARIEHMIGVEKKRVTAAAANPAKFISAIDRFYDRWKTTLGTAIDELGGDCELAVAYCDESKEALLDASGLVQPEGLSEAVERLVAAWVSRADSLADKIIGAK